MAGMIRLKLSGARTVLGRRPDASSTDVVTVDDQHVPCDRLAISDYFAPQTQLARCATVLQAYSLRGHYFYSLADGSGRTNIPGIFVCGEGTGIRGREYAAISGQLAARAYLSSVGRRIYPKPWLRVMRRLLGLYAMRLEEAMHRPMLGDTCFQPDATVCHCEDVSVQQVRDAVDVGLRDLTSIKSVTRAGMGTCQGRYCEPAVSRLVESSGAPPREGLFQKGFVRPVLVRDLIDADL
jgi:bacterioferritin-associated ferredoxin